MDIMAQIKDKIMHMLHQDKKETTPGASPGFAEVKTAPSNTTTNVPEAFYPGSRPVVPGEVHPTAPYTGALGASMPGAPSSGTETLSVPKDSAAMLGIPPVGGHVTSSPPGVSKLAPIPSQADRGTGTPMGPDNLEKDLPVVPVSDVKTVEEPATRSGLQSKNYPEQGPQGDVEEKNLSGRQVEKGDEVTDTPMEKNTGLEGESTQ